MDVEAGPPVDVALRREGYALLPGFATEELAALRAIAARFPIATTTMGFSDHSLDAARRAALARSLTEQLAPKLASVLPDHRIVSASLVAKAPGPGTSMTWHCDPSITDETRFRSVSLWIPLVDVSATRGALELLSGGHRGAPTRRGGIGTLDVTYPSHEQVMAACKGAGGQSTGPIVMAAGDAVLYDHRLPHASTNNFGPGDRVAVNLALLPSDAPLVLNIWDADGVLHAFEVPDDFFARQSVTSPPEAWIDVVPWSPPSSRGGDSLDEDQPPESASDDGMLHVADQRTRHARWDTNYDSSAVRPLLRHGYWPVLNNLARRDFHARYRQSGLRTLWSVWQPLSIVVVNGLFFHGLLNVGGDGLPYLSFIVASIMIFRYFSVGLGAASVIPDNAHLITKSYFPREILPLSAITVAFVDLGTMFLILVALTIVQGVGLSITIISLPLIVLLLVLLTVTVTLLLSTLTVFIRDITYLLPMINQIIFLGSPIMYPVSKTPASLSWINRVNPIAVIIESTRDAVLRHRWPPFGLLAVHLAVAAVGALAALAYLRSLEHRMADVA